MTPTTYGETDMHKHFIIDPNGERHTRNSRSRIYTHAVIQPHCRLGQIEWLLENAAMWRRRAAKEAASGQSFAFSNRDACLHDAEKCERLAAEHQAKYDAGSTTYFITLGWNGRLDLAQKLAATRSNTMIVEAQLV